MQIYKAPLDDMKFALETIDYEGRVASLKAFADFDLLTSMSILEEGGKFCANELLPLNRIGDQQGVSFDPETGEVTTPEGFKKLYKKYVDNGYAGIAMPTAHGGGGAPHSIANLLGEMVTGTNKSFAMCPGLTHGLVEALDAHGTDEQKKYFLPKLVSGEWTGTMCLTEPQCGTDLGLLTTRATPEGDHYRLTGTKIWITFGEHSMSENIIHLVLARLPDAPPGIKGISVFVVPKFLEDGSKNGVACGGLEHKMGIHASPTCVINMEDAVGYLVGEPHKGMRSMFTMMNAARLQVGMEGVALGEIAYQTALEFAKDRRQMRSLDPSKRDKNAKADNIMVHPDVRRMLLNVKVTTEALRHLGTWTAANIDISHHHEDEAVRARCEDLVALMTPIFKSYGTERGFDNVSEAMQVLGGSGYTTDWSIEQYLRDMRIGMIYEGTNHIQALDLVGRKLPIDNGRLFRVFQEEVSALIGESKAVDGMEEFVTPLKAASKKLVELTMNLGMKGMQDPEEAGAAASNYLNIFALTALGFAWCQQAKYALEHPENKLSATKLKSARYYMAMILPEYHSLAAIMDAGKQHMMDFDVEEF
ncbi:MAG: acyl-CoA dehydrogenase [Bradymonadia bacterium]